ncbi:N-acetylmuramoyl-L-alanine amidase [Pseudanabaena sp. FACHB-723]|uniref:N-acetylmuramoyl-L-alanine amidase n=1 Tax=Pseudanabaena mucicola FACHB-723 TaxID=2692860 RepID=A0ABR7ZYN4_9CYAN|nr:N-acetylmuramoyl-L-alanine amidase [Pseudanabaena mucicola FACHB-723]
MRRQIGLFWAGILISLLLATAINAQNFIPPTQLHLTYPPLQHTTTSDRIFFIGTAPLDGKVSINGKPIDRTSAGHFAPTLPLQLGENNFELKYINLAGNGERRINVKVVRESRTTLPPKDFGFVDDSLFPNVDIVRQPNEKICFAAIATPRATVVVKIGDQQIALSPRRTAQLPPNSSVLTGDNAASQEELDGYFSGCTVFESAQQLGQPEYELRLDDRMVRQRAKGKIEILSPRKMQVAEVTANVADARTGASTDFSRMTPLPKGTKAMITGSDGDWVRLDYGGWVRKSLVKIEESSGVTHSIVRSVNTKRIGSKVKNNIWTEVTIPLEVPVPIEINQRDRKFTVTLHNVTAQTDTIFVDPNSIIDKLDWVQTTPHQVTYTIALKPKQQWGYKVRYQGSNLIISLKHPPTIMAANLAQPLKDIKILLDAGHGSNEDLGARGPTGYPEKDVNLITTKLLEAELQSRGAKVVMTRTDDSDILLAPRVEQIDREEPTLAISIHYNALPDHGDAINTAGVGAFWYNSQAHDFAKFINTYIAQKLNRQDYGVYWNNLALVRPTTAPSVLLELGFMINPVEFEWIINPQQQKLLAATLADGITEWVLNAAN